MTQHARTTFLSIYLHIFLFPVNLLNMKWEVIRIMIHQIVAHLEIATQ